MNIGLDQPASVTIGWLQEWHRLSWAAIDQATERYLRGCADVVMARSPLMAIEAMQQAQAGLLSHSAHVFAEAIILSRKQNTDLLVMRAKYQRPPDPNNQI